MCLPKPSLLFVGLLAPTGTCGANSTFNAPMESDGQGPLARRSNEHCLSTTENLFKYYSQCQRVLRFYCYQEGTPRSQSC